MGFGAVLVSVGGYFIYHSNERQSPIQGNTIWIFVLFCVGIVWCTGNFLHFDTHTVTLICMHSYIYIHIHIHTQHSQTCKLIYIYIVLGYAPTETSSFEEWGWNVHVVWQSQSRDDVTMWFVTKFGGPQLGSSKCQYVVNWPSNPYYHTDN